MKAVVRLRDVTFTYPGAARPALAGLTVELLRGEVAVVAGPAGAGTSTFLLVAAGFAPRLTGGKLTGERELLAARAGIVFATPWTQLSGLCASVRDEVAFGPASLGLPRETVLTAAERAMRRAGAEHLAERDPAALSGGELQRVVVAAALAPAPDLLVLDDPAAELDPAGADELYALLPVLAATGVAVLVATPDLERAARAATRALVLDAGRIVADGETATTLDGTDVAEIARAAGCPVPLPLDVPGLVGRLAR
ncbi:MAG: ABC transporter ATP-binding protein [Gemmatimonadetes bacterium]|nr:ABC transporter ATP-binding protein [Gemmatimonadota bacterium]